MVNLVGDCVRQRGAIRQIRRRNDARKPETDSCKQKMAIDSYPHLACSRHGDGHRGVHYPGRDRSARSSGSSRTEGPAGPAGPPGPLAPGTSRQLVASISVSKPANGNFFAVGESPVITVTLKDQTGQAFNHGADFSQLRLMASGPVETIDTTTASKLLNASTDRTQTIHHYIDLSTNTAVQVSGATLTYKLQPVSVEKPGTYAAGVWAVLKADGLQQAFPIAEFQVGTPTVEKQIVAKDNCATCHLGTDSGKFYFAHIAPGFSPTGNWAIDSAPVEGCKLCHNNDGYSAYTPAGGTATPDPIVHRVHGVHMGAELTNPIDTDPKTGVFAAFTSVEFPKDILNCTACHTDDRWKTNPSREACGACHDSTWFGDIASMPKGNTAHKGGPQADDKTCAQCHTPDAGGVSPISVVHNAAVNAEYDNITLTMSPPANGKFYAAGDKPVVNIVINDSKGNPVDATKADTLFSTAALFVYGPRENSVPVLTTNAKVGISASFASVTDSIAASGTPKVWTFAAGDTFRIGVNGAAPQVLTAPAGPQTPDQVVAWLQSSLTGVTVTSSATAGTVTIASTVKGAGSRLEIYNSPVTTKMGWKPGPLPILKGAPFAGKVNGVTLGGPGTVIGQTAGTTMEPYVLVANVSTVSNSLIGADPAVNRTSPDKITYQLDDVKGLPPGTYMAFAYTNSATIKTDNGWPRAALGIVTFQIGTATPEPKIAENCTQCHGNTVMHLNEAHVHPALFDTDYCKACHDYGRTGTGDLWPNTGGTSTSGWAGYGAKPISARVHGVHFGNYLNHPEYVYSGNPSGFTDIIFPQDIRNCTVCHDSKTSGTWLTKPSRLACSSCHDSDAAMAHMTLMTVNPNPADPYDPNRTETCVVCHGPQADYSVAKVHNISNPYVPPYPRDGFTIP